MQSAVECQKEVLRQIVESAPWDRSHHYIKIYMWLVLNAKPRECNGKIVNTLSITPRDLEDAIRVEAHRPGNKRG